MARNYFNRYIWLIDLIQRSTVINDYYRLHLPDFPVLKSLDVLKELFD